MMKDEKELEQMLSNVQDSLRIHGAMMSDSTYNEIAAMKELLRFILGYTDEFSYREYFQRQEPNEILR